MWLVPANGRRVSEYAIAGTKFLLIINFFFVFLSGSLIVRLVRVLAPVLSPLWVTAWSLEERYGRGEVSAVEMRLIRLRFDSGKGRLLQFCRRRSFSGRWKLSYLRRHLFCRREGGAYLTPSSPSCFRKGRISKLAAAGLEPVENLGVSSYVEEWILWW